LIFLDSFESFVGGGSFGRVYRANKDGKLFAIKTVRYEDDKERDAADKEEVIFEALKGSCAYIVDYIESFDDVFFLFFINGTL
jgi:hypothetical protein